MAFIKRMKGDEAPFTRILPSPLAKGRGIKGEGFYKVKQEGCRHMSTYSLDPGLGPVADWFPESFD